jgi:hypothetical protein
LSFGGGGFGVMGLTVLYLRGGGGVGVNKIAASSLRGGAVGVMGLTVLYLRGGGGVGVGVMRIAALSLRDRRGGVMEPSMLYGRGGGVCVTGFAESYLCGRGVDVTGLAVLYLRGGGGVGVMRYGLLSVRCGRGAGLKLALSSLRDARGVVFGFAIALPLDTGSR